MLVTPRFAVWDSPAAAAAAAGGAEGRGRREKGSAILIISGKPLTLVEVARVAMCNTEVVLDVPSLDKIREMCKPAGGASVTDAGLSGGSNSESSPALPVSICRAALLSRITSLMHGRADVRPEVIELLATMLNADVIPQFTSEAMAGRELVCALIGASSAKFYSPDGETLKIGAVNLTSAEKSTLLGGQFLTTGASCLIAAGAVNLSKSFDSVSSLSCEGFGAASEFYEADRFETCRQHRGQILSASNLRLMLEGSKRINNPVVVGKTVFQTIPQVHGPVQDAINAAAKALELELNSSDPSALKSDASGLDPTQSLVALQSIVSAISIVTEAASARSALLRSSAAPSSSSCAPSSLTKRVLGGDFSAALALLQRLANVMAREVQLAIGVFNAIEKNNAGAGGDAGGDEDEEGGSNKKKGGEGVGGKPVTDDPNWTPEQRAKAEAKRQAKAEKAQQKAASKQAKKGPVSSPSSLESLVDPFNFSEQGLGAFSSTLLERLNSGGKRKPKIPKGARDFTPEQMKIREQVFATIRRVFKRHGGVEIDTPVFELKEVLTGKYGEDSKLIYDLADQGGELLSLRYDLTVPFARFLAMNSVGNIKRFHMAKVYRRDQPQLNRGRYREFYQCDFDVAGSFSPMVPDAEVITVAREILTELPVGSFVIKLNHRKLLDAIFEICGVPAEKFRAICSAVDKLDKAPWQEVKLEMVEEKGLPAGVADRIGEFVLNSGEPKALWAALTQRNIFGTHEVANATMADMKVLFDYLDAMGSLGSVSFDLSLARGLDYYTGVIYEAVIIDKGGVQVGSIAGGGRYDNLVGMFSPSGAQTPCVGVSIGIERIFTIMERKAEEMKLTQISGIQAYIASIGSETIMLRMSVAQKLWASDIPTEYSHKDNPKLKTQMDEVLERGIPFMVIFGKDEMTKGVVKVKNMAGHSETEVPLEGLVACLLEQGCTPIFAAERTYLKQLQGEAEM